MVRGRKPKAIEVQERSGAYVKNPQRRNKNAPTVEHSIPAAPETVSLDPIALDKWHHVCKILHDMGILATSDRDLLETYCITYALYRTALKNVLAEGNTVVTEKGSVVRNPECVEMHKAMDRMTKLLAELGLTPSARARVHSTKQQEEEDPFKLLLDRMAS